MLPFKFACKQYKKFTKELNSFIDSIIFKNGYTFFSLEKKAQISFLYEFIKKHRFQYMPLVFTEIEVSSDNRFLCFSGATTFNTDYDIIAEFYINSEDNSFHCYLNNVQINKNEYDKNITINYFISIRELKITLQCHKDSYNAKLHLDLYVPTLVKLSGNFDLPYSKSVFFESSLNFLKSLKILSENEDLNDLNIIFNKNKPIEEKDIEKFELLYDIKIDKNNDVIFCLNDVIKSYKSLKKMRYKDRMNTY